MAGGIGFNRGVSGKVPGVRCPVGCDSVHLRSSVSRRDRIVQVLKNPRVGGSIPSLAIPEQHRSQLFREWPTCALAFVCDGFLRSDLPGPAAARNLVSARTTCRARRRIIAQTLCRCPVGDAAASVVDTARTEKLGSRISGFPEYSLRQPKPACMRIHRHEGWCIACVSTLALTPYDSIPYGSSRAQSRHAPCDRGARGAG
jgi:hypothetical protein